MPEWPRPAAIRKSAPPPMAPGWGAEARHAPGPGPRHDGRGVARMDDGGDHVRRTVEHDDGTRDRRDVEVDPARPIGDAVVRVALEAVGEHRRDRLDPRSPPGR